MLKVVDVSPYTGRESPSPDQMAATSENEFFFLLFSDYTNIDRPKPFKDAASVIRAIADCDSYGEFRSRITAKSVLPQQEYQDFIASLRQNLEPIEKVRNAVAHNRAVGRRQLANYDTARPILEAAVDQLLAALLERTGKSDEVSP